PKRQQVRQGIVLHPKSTGRPRQTGHFPIQTIEPRSQQDHQGGISILIIMRVDHTEKTTDEVRRRKKIWKKVFAFFHAPGGSFKKASIVSPSTGWIYAFTPKYSL